MIKVSIIEDDIQVAEELTHTVNFQSEYEVVSVFNSYQNAMPWLANEMPDVLLLDINLPGLSGVEAIPDIKRITPETKIIMLTSSNDDAHIFDSLKAGADGYLTKNSSVSQLIGAIALAIEGGAPLSNAVAIKVISSFRPSSKEYEFTKREKDIIKLMVLGKRRKQIGAKLFIEESTVKYHLSKIYKKLDVSTRAEAIAKVISEKIV